MKFFFFKLKHKKETDEHLSSDEKSILKISDEIRALKKMRSNLTNPFWTSYNTSFGMLTQTAAFFGGAMTFTTHSSPDPMQERKQHQINNIALKIDHLEQTLMEKNILLSIQAATDLPKCLSQEIHSFLGY